jgi:hypothetical protein
MSGPGSSGEPLAQPPGEEEQDEQEEEEEGEAEDTGDQPSQKRKTV